MSTPKRKPAPPPHRFSKRLYNVMAQVRAAAEDEREEWLDDTDLASDLREALDDTRCVTVASDGDGDDQHDAGIELRDLLEDAICEAEMLAHMFASTAADLTKLHTSLQKALYPKRRK